MSESNEPASPGEQQPGGSARHGPGHRRRRRRKVRTRIRIKKKANPLRKAKKAVEKIIWVVVIAAFIATLVILMKQLDVKDERQKKKKKKSTGWELMPSSAAGTACQMAWFPDGRPGHGPVGIVNRYG